MVSQKKIRMKQLTLIAEKVSGRENCDAGKFNIWTSGFSQIYASPLSRKKCNKMVFFQDTTEGKRGVRRVMTAWQTPKGRRACDKVVLRLAILVLFGPEVDKLKRERFCYAWKSLFLINFINQYCHLKIKLKFKKDNEMH